MIKLIMFIIAFLGVSIKGYFRKKIILQVAKGFIPRMQVSSRLKTIQGKPQTL
jgi:hypothetical protein